MSKLFAGMGLCGAGILCFLMFGAAPAEPTSETKKSYTCVFPKPEKSSRVLKYIEKKLGEAKAPAGVEIGIAFKNDTADLTLAQAGKSYRVKWRLKEDCSGAMVLQSKLKKEAPIWLKPIHSQGFIKGLPITLETPKSPEVPKQGDTSVEAPKSPEAK